MKTLPLLNCVSKLRSVRTIMVMWFALSIVHGTAQFIGFIPNDHKGEAPSSTIAYMPNLGQLQSLQGTAVPNIAYYSVQAAPQMFFSKDNTIHFSLGLRDTTMATPDTVYRISVRFAGESSESCIPVADEATDDSYNFILGHCPNGIYGVRPSKRIIYKDIYRYIDLHIYSNAWGPKMYLVMRPGSNPTQIKMRFEGQDALLTDLLGNLVAIKENKAVLLPKGLCYQQIGNTTQLISAGLEYALYEGGGTVGFAFQAYNPAYPLIIDISASMGGGGSEIYPTPEWCTFYGNTEVDIAKDAAILPNGDLVTCGFTYSPNFPLFNEQFDEFDGGQEAFFSYFSNEYERRMTTFFGGNSGDEANSLALTTDGASVYLYGRTFSTNLPIFGNGGYLDTQNTDWACFIAKFSLVGNPLGIPELATYFGDNRNTHTCPCIRTDINNNVYVIGSSLTPSSTYPLVNTCSVPPAGFPMCNALGPDAYFQNYAGENDAYIARFDSDFNLVHSTRFGGYNAEAGTSLAIDKDRDLVVFTGHTNSQRRPTPFCEPPTPGFTTMGFPLCDAGQGYFQSELNGTNSGLNYDAFVAALRISDGKLVWSTFLGGPGLDYGEALGFNKESGSAMVAGVTQGPNYATNNCTPPTGGGFPRCGVNIQSYGGGNTDAYIARFSLNDFSMKWSTFLGGGGFEKINSVNHRFGRQMLLAGSTNSGSNQLTPFPTVETTVMYYKGTHNDATTGAVEIDGIVIVLDETEGDHIEHATYLGGVGNDVAWVAVSKDESRIYTAGLSSSTSSIPFKCPPTETPYCNESYATVSPSRSDVLYSQLVYDLTIGVEENNAGTEENLFELTLYPNPTNGDCRIELDDELTQEGIPRIEVYDGTGRLVTSPLISLISGSTWGFNLGDFQMGVYFFRLSTARTNRIRTAKIVVQ